MIAYCLSKAPVYKNLESTFLYLVFCSIHACRSTVPLSAPYRIIARPLQVSINLIDVLHLMEAPFHRRIWLRLFCCSVCLKQWMLRSAVLCLSYPPSLGEDVLVHISILLFPFADKSSMHSSSLQLISGVFTHSLRERYALTSLYYLFIG